MGRNDLLLSEGYDLRYQRSWLQNILRSKSFVVEGEVVARPHLPGKDWFGMLEEQKQCRCVGNVV